MAKKSVSELKFLTSDWLLDEMGFDSDPYVELLQKAQSYDELGLAAQEIRKKMAISSMDLATKFFKFWTKLALSTS